MAGFFRYPGGKSKLKKRIASKIQGMLDSIPGCDEYREPFFGGGSIGLSVVKDRPWHLRRVWANDADVGVAALWTTLITRPNLLIDLVRGFVPSVEAFDEYKRDLISVNRSVFLESDQVIANIGFKKLAIHQISYSGLGTKSGGPLGGRDQKSAYKIDCRWSPDYICKKIMDIHNTLNGIGTCYRTSFCTNLDFSDVILDDRDEAVIYLDPPYYNKGNDLYQHGMSNDDHARLSQCLKTSPHSWLLSYDDCQEVRDMYEWANIEVIEEVSYSITATKNKGTGERASRVKSELLITPR